MRSQLEIATWQMLEAGAAELRRVFGDPKCGYGQQLGALATFRRRTDEYMKLFGSRRGRGLQTIAGVKSKDQPVEWTDVSGGAGGGKHG